MSDQKYVIGSKIEVINDFCPGRLVHVCFGEVVRVTATQIVVKNEHGNESRFRLKDGRQVGYSWPYLTNALRRVI